MARVGRPPWYTEKKRLSYRQCTRKNRIVNRKLLISRAPTKARSQEPAYSQALNQNKIDRQRQDKESEAGRPSDGYGGWCLQLRRGGRYGVWGGMGKTMNQESI